MPGFPPKKEALVTIDNAMTTREKQRWALRNTRELMPTQRISRGRSPVVELPRDSMPVSDFNNLRLSDLSGKAMSVAELLERQHTDAILVMVDGRIVNEQYLGGMTPDQPHDLYSAGKSLTSTLIGTLLGRELDEQSPIQQYLPELENTALAGATIRDLLDMKSGLDYDYGFAPNAEVSKHMAMTHGVASGAETQSQWQLLQEASKSRAHGKVMRYKELDVLAVVLAVERNLQIRFADLLSQRIWSKLGAEHDAYIRCDGYGTAVPSFGLCATLRDMARWGQMCLNLGEFHGKRIVPSNYLQDVRTGVTQVVPAEDWIDGIKLELPAGTAYRSWFWFPGLTRDSFAASGGFGQLCYMNWRHQTLIACFSSWMGDDKFEQLEQTYWSAFEQLTQILHSRRR